MRRITPVMLVFACLAATGTARAENPIQFFERLMGPPARTMEQALRPHVPAHKARTAKPDAPQPDVPQPEVAPPEAAQAQAPQPETPSATTDLLSVPMPHLRPGDAGEPALGYAPATGIEAAPLAPKSPATAIITPPLKGPPPATLSTCGAVIADLGVEATPMTPVVDGSCVIPAPVSIKGLDRGAVAFSTEALLNCSLAEALATWMASTVQPIATRTLGGKVTGLRIAASYSCRNRDNLADAKLSEHARGNAIDISAFKVDGVGWIDVASGWNGGGDKAEFLRAVRSSACGPFTTVLGPGTDSYHSSHFHLDRAKRRTAGPSKGLYCK